MASFVWERDPQEAFSNPYEYKGQEQFVREATALLDAVHEFYGNKNRSYHRDDISAEKAVWMLQVDSLEALREALVLTKEKRHRTASRLFRDSLETQDLSFYFSRGGNAAKKHLAKWYSDEVVPHRIAREFVKSVHGPEKWEELKALYGGLSKYIHRTYRALAKSYILGQGDILVYDGFRIVSTTLVLPHVISFSYAVLAMLIRRFLEIAVASQVLKRAAADTFWTQAMEKKQVPRRFTAVMYVGGN